MSDENTSTTETTAADQAALDAAAQAAATTEETKVTAAAADTALDLDAAPETTTTAEETTVVNVPKTGNAAVDEVGELFASKNVTGADAIIANYAETGDVSIADQAKLVEALGDTVANLAIKQLKHEAERLVTAKRAQRSETLDYANKLFDGVDADTTWGQIQEFVKTPEAGFSPEDRAAMTKMLAAGGLQARLVIDNISAVYNKSPNTTTTADLLAGDTQVQGNAFTPISAKDYATELSVLQQKHGYDSIQVQQLQQRRLQSRNQGVA